jgi:hypothetical protein
MASPTTPSDSPNGKSAAASKHEAPHTNFLDILQSGIEKNVAAPAFNSLAVEPVNAAGNVVNAASRGGTWLYDKFTGSNHQALQLVKVQELEVGKVEKNSIGSWSQQICGTAGSFLAYAVAGKVAGGALRFGASALPAELAIGDLKLGVAARTVAQNRSLATIIGATGYAGLKDPKEGESRKSNMLSTLVGFSFFEAGNAYFVKPSASTLTQAERRFAVGVAGGLIQSDVASYVQTGKSADIGANFSSALAGGALNALMPAGHRAADALVENPLVKGVPHVTEATGRLYSDAAKSLQGKAVLRGSWADPEAVRAVNRMAIYDLKTRLNFKPGLDILRRQSANSSSATELGQGVVHESSGEAQKIKSEQIYIDQKANVIHAPDASPRDVIHELAHRQIFKDPNYEKQFKSHAGNLVSFDPVDPRNAPVKQEFIETRLDQEVAARSVENRQAANLGDLRQSSVDRNHILNEEGYAKRFELEANEFVRSGGRFRPEVDFSSSNLPLRTSYEQAGVEAVNPVTLEGAARLAAHDAAGDTNFSPEGAHSGAAVDVTAAREARISRITKWDRLSTQIIRSSTDPKDRPQNNLYAVVRERLNAIGLTRDGWTVLPTETGSPLDQVGCDYALVNAKKNQVIFLDATQNGAKLSNPAAHNVSEIRAGGLIGFESRWMDMMGRLKIDDEGAIGLDAKYFRSGLDSQLKELAAHGSPITVEMLPSPMRQATVYDTQAQVDAFTKALIKRSAQYGQSSIERHQLETFAKDIQHGAAKFNEFQIVTRPSPELSGAMQKQADRVVLDYVLKKMHFKDRVESPQVASSNLAVTKSGRMVMRVDGALYDGGDVKSAIAEARRGLRADSAKLDELLSKDKSVQNKMRSDGLTLTQVKRLVQEELISAREVDNGMLGTTNIGLESALRNRLAAQRLDDVVAGRTPSVEKAAAEKTVSSGVPERPGAKIDSTPAFTAEQQAEIPQMANVMSEFGISIKDGVDPNELKTFVQMYAESAKTAGARQLAVDYIAESEKPIGQQRLIPRMHGALIEAQMRLEAQRSSVDGLVQNGSTVAQFPLEVGKPGVSADKNVGTQLGADGSLPFEQVKQALERLHELQGKNSLTVDEQFQLEALKAFKTHMMEASTREAVAVNARKLSSGAQAGVQALTLMAIAQWYRDSLRPDSSTRSSPA